MNFLCKIIIFCSALATCFSPSLVFCQEPHSPTSAKNVLQTPAMEDTESEINAGAWLVSFFRDHISAVDGERCPSLPSCSSYSVMAFKKHGFFIGWLMTVDRLIHEADEGSLSPLVHYNGRVKILDPLENNDFWWFSNDEKNRK